MNESGHINLDALFEAENAIWLELNKSVGVYGEGFKGAPRITEDAVNGVNQWWIGIGGGASIKVTRNATVTMFDGAGTIEGVFSDRRRALKFALATYNTLPIKNIANVATCYRAVQNFTCEYAKFEIEGRGGNTPAIWVWHVSVPIDVVVDLLKREPEISEVYE